MASPLRVHDRRRSAGRSNAERRFLQIVARTVPDENGANAVGPADQNSSNSSVSRWKWNRRWNQQSAILEHVFCKIQSFQRRCPGNEERVFIFAFCLTHPILCQKKWRIWNTPFNVENSKIIFYKTSLLHYFRLISATCLQKTGLETRFWADKPVSWPVFLWQVGEASLLPIYQYRIYSVQYF